MRLIVGGTVLFLVVGCGSVKEYVPIRPGSVALKMPNQQRMVATSTTEAIRGAIVDPKLNLAQYKGLKGRVEVNGVFPPSKEELLEYIATAVEGEMLQAGIQVLPREVPAAVSVHGGGQNVTIEPKETQPELRVVTSLDWAGVDYEETQQLLGTKVGVCVVLAVFTAGIGCAIYAAFTDFKEHIFTLKSRVHITVRAMPTVAGRPIGLGIGEGESKIVIDANSASGYAADLTIPEKKSP